MKTIKRHISTTSYSLTYILIGVVIFLTPTTIALAQSLPAVDRDTDDDNLIEVGTLAQLNAIRHDSDGDGTSTESAYNSVLGSSLTNSGCPSTCTGYELTADLDFDTDGDGSFDSGDDFYNGGSGWLPIGTGNTPFNTTFNGNGHTISNLTVKRSTHYRGGLFGELGSDAIVRNLGLDNVFVNARGATTSNPGDHGVGGLAGVNRGLIYHTYTTGVVAGKGQQRYTGGSVGLNLGRILASYSKASVSGDYDVGGLVGHNKGSVIWTYATGDVSHRGFDAGGLVGEQSSDGEIKYSYSTGDVTDGNSNSPAGGLTSDKSDSGTITQSYFDSDRSNRPSSDSHSKTSSQLQSPTSASGIFSDWAKAEHIIYEGTLTPGRGTGAYSNRYGYGTLDENEDVYGTLSPTAIGSYTIEKLYYVSILAYSSIFIRITENDADVCVDADNVLTEGDIVTLIQGSTTITSPIDDPLCDMRADQLDNDFTKSSMDAMFQGSSPFTIRFGEPIAGTGHTVDPSNLWDFGTSSDLPLLSIDFNGDGTASVEEFGEQGPDETKPVITLNGDDTISLVEGDPYTDAGAEVMDPGNSDYTGVVSTAIEGPTGQTSFDSAVVGDWTFTYTANADSFGNVPDPVTRVVTITSSTIFSATFTPGNVISPPNEDGISGHQLPSHNALTNDVGVAHNTFTLSGVEYTINIFSYESSGNLYFRIKSGSNHVDEQTVFADYSLVIVNENDETFTKEIAEFEYSTNSLNNWAVLDIPKPSGGSNPFEYTDTWESWNNDNTITVEFSIVKTSSLGASLDFDGNGTFTPSQDALALYLVTQLSTNANTLSSYVHDGATETASTTITLVNSLTSGTSLDFDGSETFVPSQDALALYLATQLSANANTLASYVYDRSSETAGNTITLINTLVERVNG